MSIYFPRLNLVSVVLLIFLFKHCKAKLYSFALLTGGGWWALTGSFRWNSSRVMMTLQYWFYTTSPSTISIIHHFQFISCKHRATLFFWIQRGFFFFNNSVQVIFTIHNTKELICVYHFSLTKPRDSLTAGFLKQNQYEYA